MRNNLTATLRGSETLPKHIVDRLMKYTSRACVPAKCLFQALNNNHRGVCHSH